MENLTGSTAPQHSHPPARVGGADHSPELGLRGPVLPWPGSPQTLPKPGVCRGVGFTAGGRGSLRGLQWALKGSRILSHPWLGTDRACLGTLGTPAHTTTGPPSGTGGSPRTSWTHGGIVSLQGTRPPARPEQRPYPMIHSGKGLTGQKQRRGAAQLSPTRGMKNGSHTGNWTNARDLVLTLGWGR